VEIEKTPLKPGNAMIPMSHNDTRRSDGFENPIQRIHPAKILEFRALSRRIADIADDVDSY
jgi:hypothetical protein